MDGASGNEQRYEKIREIGRGGMGAVYLGIDHELHRNVAIKNLAESSTNRHIPSDQLRGEAKLLARLNHAHIVQVYDLATIDGEAAIVMEYIDGHSLHVHVRENRFEITTLLKWFTQIADAIAYAHSAGVSHGDIKVENILLTPTGDAKLADFGIGAGDQADHLARDLQMLGRCILQLLKQIPHDLHGLVNFCEQLASDQIKENASAEVVAREIRRYWHQSTQTDTEVPIEDQQPPGRTIRWYQLALGLALMVVAIGAIWWTTTDNSDVKSIAIVIDDSAGSRAIGQGVSDYLLSQPHIQLLSQYDTVQLVSEGLLLPELAQVLGSDEILTIKLQCDEKLCHSSIQRLTRDNGWLVAAEQRFSSPLDQPTTSFQIAQHQAALLYSDERSQNARNSLDEADLLAYLSIRESLASKDADLMASSQQLVDLINRNPSFSPLYFLYSELALELYDVFGDDQVITLATNSLANAERWTTPSLSLYEAKADLALAANNFKLASEHINAINDMGAYVLAEKLRGQWYSLQGKHGEAAVHFDRAISAKPNRELYYHAAFNHFDAGDKEAARDYLQRSVDRYPNDHNALNTLGMIALEAGELDKASSHFSEAISLHSNTIYQTNLGLAYLLASDYEQAGNIFDSLLRAGNHNPHLLLNAADARKLKGDQESADQIYRQLIENNDHDLNVLAQAHAHLGNFETAIYLIEQKKISGVDIADTAYGASIVYLLAAQYLVALSEMERAISLGIGHVWFNLTWFDQLCHEPTSRSFERLLPERKSCLEIRP